MPPKGVKIAAPVAPPDTTSLAAQQQAGNLVSIADLELPRTTLTKLAKGSVGRVDADFN